MIAGNFTKTPNWLFGLMPVMTEPELRITLATARETVGRQKKTAGISLTDYEGLTGMSRSAVDSGLRRAKARGTIIEVGKGKRGKKLYDFNADYTSKETSSPETIVSETIVPVADKVQSSTPTSSPKTTRNTKKEVLKEKRKKKDIAPVGTSSHSHETVSGINGEAPATELPPAPDAAAPLPPPDEKPPQTAYMAALADAFGYDLKTMTKTLRGNFGKVAAELRESCFPTDHIGGLYRFVERLAKDGNWSSWTVNVLTTKAEEYRKKYLPAVRYEFVPAQPPAPETEPVYATDEEIADVLAHFARVAGGEWV